MCLSICYDGVMVEYVGVGGQVSVSNHAFYLVAAVFLLFLLPCVLQATWLASIRVAFFPPPPFSS